MNRRISPSRALALVLTLLGLTLTSGCMTDPCEDYYGPEYMEVPVDMWDTSAETSGDKICENVLTGTLWDHPDGTPAPYG